MKRIFGSAILVLSFVCISNVQADNQQSINGLVLGAGGGALVGQAIGGNTESTVIGSAIGGVVGYIIGSEMDSSGTVYRSGSSRHHHPRVHREKVVVYENHHVEPPPHAAEYRHCRKAELIGTVRGRAEKIHATVCETGRGWEIVSEGPVVHQDLHYVKHWAPRPPVHPRKPLKRRLLKRKIIRIVY